MSVNYEGGHVKNIANFEVLIACVEKHGKAYNPSHEQLLPEQLRKSWEKAKAANEQLNEAISVYKTSMNARHLVFKPLSRLVSRINRLTLVLGVSEKDRSSVRSTVRKVQGTRAQARLNEQDIALLIEQGKEIPLQKSSSQTSYDYRVNHLEQLIKLLDLTPDYAPNEEALKIEALMAYLDLLRTHNSIVKHARVDLTRARMERNRLMYSPTEGLGTLTSLVKNYIYVVFGLKSTQAKEMFAIPFRRYKYVVPINDEERTTEEVAPPTPPETDPS